MLRRPVARLRHHGEDETGSTLVLYPFAVLIVLGLGGVALDLALFFQAHRESVDVAAGLAHDIAGVLDEGVFATSGEIVIDTGRAQVLVDLTNGDLVGHPSGLHCSAAVRPAAPATVDVTCAGTAAPVLLPAVGLLGRMDLRGTATASAVTQ